VSDENESGGGGEIDALKWFIWGMLVVSVLGGGAIWWFQKQTTALRASIESTKGAMRELAASKGEIVAMVGAFKKNREDVARDQPLTWFSEIWKRKGIDNASMDPDKWKDPPEIAPDGSYVEEKYSIGFKRTNPLRREQIGQFLHDVEHSSSRLRILTLTVSRAGRDETIEQDEWTGKCEIGYRYPRVK